MKKRFSPIVALMASALLASCGQAGDAQGSDALSDSLGTVSLSSPDSESDNSGEEETAASDSGTGGNPESEKEGGEPTVEEEAFLSEHILKTGDTMQIMYPEDEDTLYLGLELTLGSAAFYDSPETASLDRAQMEPQTENYDLSGNPEWCEIDGARILTCDLTVKNNDKDTNGDLHIGEFMIAYADPDTGKVTIVSCAPAYFSASSSQVGASDYYHYQLAKDDSKEMKVAWLIQEQYAPENLYLCVTYDVRSPEERQYFKLTE